MSDQMTKETLASFDLTPEEIEAFSDLQEFAAAHDQQQHLNDELPHTQNMDSGVEDSIDKRIPPTSPYINVDPQLLSPCSNSNRLGDPIDEVHDLESPYYDSTTFLNTPVHVGVEPLSPHLKVQYSAPGELIEFRPPFVPDDPFHDAHPRFSSETLLRSQMMGHRRSISVPPEELSVRPVTFSRAGTPLGRSYTRGSGPCSRGGRLYQSHLANDVRAAPYILPNTDRGSNVHDARRTAYRSARPSGRPRGRASTRGRPVKNRSEDTLIINGGPTSAPQGSIDSHTYASAGADIYYPPEMYAPEMSIEEREKAWFDRVDVKELLAHGSSGGMSTADIIALAKLNSLAMDIEALKEVLKRDYRGRFEDISFDGRVMECELESIYRRKRAFNSTKISLADDLAVLPFILSDEEALTDVNGASGYHNGQVIRDLDVEGVEKLLQRYELPFPMGMFLFEKKLLLLKFIGISRELMHKILD